MAFLRALPICALAFAALDCVYVSIRTASGPDVARFPQAVLLWLGLGVVAILPAMLLRRFFGKDRREWTGERKPGASSGAALAFCTALPVLAHGQLDAYTSLGGDLSGLASPMPWLRLVLVIGILYAAARICGWLYARSSKLALVTGIASVAVGIVAGLDFADSDSDVPDTASAGDKPNLMLIVWDTARSMSLGPYDYSRDTTDWLTRFAESSIVFEGARSASRFTLTSHLSMLTGTYPSHHGARMTHQTFDPLETPSLASELLTAGYRTGAFVGTAVLDARTRIGTGFEHYDDGVDPAVCDTAAWSMVHDVQAILATRVPGLSFNGLPHWFEDFQRPAPEVFDAAARWIAEDDGRPWFCMVNVYDVHWPHLPDGDARERWVRSYEGPVDGYIFRSDRYEKGYELTEEDDVHLLDLYDAEMWQLDRVTERFVDGLDLSSTAVLLTSDHGEAFGEAGVYSHDDLFEPQLRIPLILRLPGDERAGTRISGPISGIDVAPTLLGLGGVERPASMLAGVDLLNETAPPDRLVLVEDRDHMERDDIRLALYQGTWKLLRTGPTEEEATYELFDLTRDTLGVDDVSAEHPEVASDLREKLVAMRARWGPKDGGEGGGDINFDALNALGYTGEDDP